MRKPKVLFLDDVPIPTRRDDSREREDKEWLANVMQGRGGNLYERLVASIKSHFPLSPEPKKEYGVVRETEEQYA